MAVFPVPPEAEENWQPWRQGVMDAINRLMQFQPQAQGQQSLPEMIAGMMIPGSMREAVGSDVMGLGQMPLFSAEGFMQDVGQKIGTKYVPYFYSLNKFTPETLNPMEGPIIKTLNAPMGADWRGIKIHVDPNKLKESASRGYLKEWLGVMPGHEIGHNLLRQIKDKDILQNITGELIAKYGKPNIVPMGHGWAKDFYQPHPDMVEFVSNLLKTSANDPHTQRIAQYMSRQYGDLGLPMSIPYEEFIAEAIGSRAYPYRNIKWQEWPINWELLNRYFK